MIKQLLIPFFWLKSMVNRIFEASIWAEGAIPDQEWKYRNLKRVLLPILDLIFICSGVVATVVGIPAISKFFPSPIVFLFGLTLIIIAIGCLIGVAFPQFWPLEMACESILLGILASYALALIIVTLANESNRAFGLTLVIGLMCVVVWRLSLLGAEWQTRKLLERYSNE